MMATQMCCLGNGINQRLRQTTLYGNSRVFVKHTTGPVMKPVCSSGG